MPLIKDNTLVDDDWVTVGEDAAVPSAGDVEKLIIPYSIWEKERESLRGRNGCLGIRLPSDQHPKLIEGDLDLFDVVALEFPTFKDGRAYSYARLLRDQYGYKGEIRAVGEVLRDQWYFMARCGFNAFDVGSEFDETDWVAAMAEFSVPYQPAADGRDDVIKLRNNG